MKMPQAQSLRTPRCRLCASVRSRNAHGHLTKANLFENLQEKCHAPKIGTHPLCKPARSTCPSHVTSCENSQGKNRPKIEPKPRPSLCASLRSWNAHGYRTKPLLCENLQQRCRAPKSVPWSSPGLNTFCKNPSVWTHTPWCPQSPPHQRWTSTPGPI